MYPSILKLRLPRFGIHLTAMFSYHHPQVFCSIFRNLADIVPLVQVNLKYKEHRIELRDYSRIELCDNSRIELCDNSRIELCDYS